jgi:hypothetical protein
MAWTGLSDASRYAVGVNDPTGVGVLTDAEPIRQTLSPGIVLVICAVVA